MAIGQQIFQLAQGIISNERQRKQLEQQEQRFQQQQQQAERTFQLKQQEVQARQGFLQVQQQQLELQNAQAPLRQEQAKLDLQLKQAEIQLTQARAQAVGQGKPQPFSSSLVSKTEEILSEVTKRKNLQLVQTEGAPEVLTKGFNITGVATPDEALKAVARIDNQIAQLGKSAFAKEVQAQIAELQDNRKTVVEYAQALTKAQTERPIDREEFLNVAPVFGMDRDQATRQIEDIKPLSAFRQEAFGADVPSKTFQIAVESLQAGNPKVLTGFIQSNPGRILTDGQITREGAVLLADTLKAHGVATSNIKEYIRGLVEAQKGN